jgi:tetratricopeptide (TPR) repeat protein
MSVAEKRAFFERAMNQPKYEIPRPTSTAKRQFQNSVKSKEPQILVQEPEVKVPRRIVPQQTRYETTNLQPKPQSVVQQSAPVQEERTQTRQEFEPISKKTSIPKATPSFVGEEDDEYDKCADLALKAFNRGSQLLNQKHFRDAISEFDTAIKNAKKYKSLLEIFTKSVYMRAQTHKSAGNENEAIQDYTDAISLARLLKDQEPEAKIKLSTYHYALANALNNNNQFEKAIQEYSESINWLERDNADNATCAAAYYNRGMAFLSLERLDEASEDFQKAIAYILQDSNINKDVLLDSYYYLARCYQLAGDNVKALECYNTITNDLDPNHLLSNYHKARILYYNEDDFRGAIAAFNRVLAVNPNDDSSYYNRGMSYKFLEEWDNAIADFHRATEVNNRFMKAYIELARAIANRDGKDANDEELLNIYNHALYLFENKKEDQKTAPLGKQEIAQVYFERGIILNKQKKFQEAVKDYDMCCDLDRLHEDAYFNRGVIYSRELKQPDRAFNDFEHVLKFVEDVPTLTERAVLNISLNNIDAARTDLNRVLELQPDNEVGYGLLEYILSL